MQSDEEEIRKLVATWMEATRAGDLETLLGLMADDEGRSEIQEIRVFGDWACMWATLSVTVTPPGGAPPMMRAGNTLTVLRKEDDRWVLARDANMLSPVPPDSPSTPR